MKHPPNFWVQKSHNHPFIMAMNAETTLVSKDYHNKTLVKELQHAIVFVAVNHLFISKTSLTIMHKEELLVTFISLLHMQQWTAHFIY